jgi:hypothetical protein
MTPHGFIRDEDKDLKDYKANNQQEWERILGGGDFDIIEEEAENTSPDLYDKET